MSLALGNHDVLDGGTYFSLVPKVSAMWNGGHTDYQPT